MGNHDSLLDKPKQELVKIIHQLENDIENSSTNVDILLDGFGFSLNPLQMSIDWHDKFGNLIRFHRCGVDFDVNAEFLEDNKIMPNNINYASDKCVCEECEDDYTGVFEEIDTIEIAKQIISDMDSRYKANMIHALDNDFELFDNDIRKIAKHLLVEIGDM